VNAGQRQLEPQRKVTAVLDALKGTYGRQRRGRRDPLEVLVRGILSQNTSDVNSARAYQALRKRFATWQQVANAMPADIALTIKCGGLANQKAEAIRCALVKLSENGNPSVNRLMHMDSPAAERELTAIKGVGIKTARLVLLFGFGRPVFVVDTHVHRVARRAGLVPPQTGREKAHMLLDELIPDNRKYEAHINLIRHGRQCCRARKPLCGECCIRKWCAFAHGKS